MDTVQSVAGRGEASVCTLHTTTHVRQATLACQRELVLAAAHITHIMRHMRGAARICEELGSCTSSIKVQR